MRWLARRFLLVLSASVLSLFSNAQPSSAVFLALDYAPLQPGGEYIYLENGSFELKQVVQDDLEVVNGIPTFVILDVTGGTEGSSLNLTNDSNGFRLHKVFVPDPSADPDATFLFDPPLITLLAAVDAGEVINSSGIVSLTFAGFGTFALNYSATSNVIGLESVTVPLATFDALRIDSTLRVFGNILGNPFDQTSAGTDWYGFRVGPVKSTADGDVSELVETNVPEPSAALLALTALITLATLARRGGRSVPTRATSAPKVWD